MALVVLQQIVERLKTWKLDHPSQAGEDYQVRNVAQRNAWGQSPAELATSAPEWLQRHLRSVLLSLPIFSFFVAQDQVMASCIETASTGSTVSTVSTVCREQERQELKHSEECKNAPLVERLGF